MSETENKPKISRWSADALGWPKPKFIFLGLITVFALALPFVAPNRSWITVATLAMIWITLNQSWNLVLGFSGVWNFGQLAFYAIGAYTAALLTLHSPLPPFVNLVLGGIAASIIAIILSIPVLRLRGIYVSLLTFGFAEVIRLLIIADKSGTTGGTYGLSGFGGFGFEDLDLATVANVNYWITLGFAFFATLIVLLIVRTPLGNGFIALRDNPSLAAARGLSPRTFQMLVFAISGFIAGVAGGLYAFVFGVVAPTLMGLGPMTLLVTMLVVGGLGTVMGPIVGTLIIASVQAQLEQWPEVRLMFLGVILLVMILAWPRGLVPVFAELNRKLQRWMDGGR
jgi:branched-chain amino acid transport system permease protein